MLPEMRLIIRREVEEGTGAAISIEVERGAAQAGICLWFSDLDRSHSPCVTLRPKGLRRFEAQLSFGSFAADTIQQISQAKPEEIQLARALVSSVARNAAVEISNGQGLNEWIVDSGRFRIYAEKRGIESRFGEDALVATCRELVTPLLAAMAELYGYDPIEDLAPEEGFFEGAVQLALIRRRERNPRNRLLCLRVHGSSCKICGLDPNQKYGVAGSIIEVHHLQPISLNGGVRQYDPAVDLIPLCPNCHRAVHTSSPVPWTPLEIQERFRHGQQVSVASD